MPRAQVATTDLVADLVALLNGTTLMGGTVKAVADGQTVRVFVHADGATPGVANQFNLLIV